MSRTLALIACAALLAACGDDASKTDPDGEAAAEGLSFWPPEAGRGTSFDARLSAGSSVFTFDGTDSSFPDGVTVDSVTVLDGWTATAVVTVASDAPLGARDLTVERDGSTDLHIDGALTIVDDSFTLNPDRARIGESIQVELVGQNTEWVGGDTWAYFGDGIDVTGVDILTPSYALVDITVEPDAVPGSYDVAVESGRELTTLYGGFQVDRVSLSARFTPSRAYQGDTVDFTITGDGTHFSSASDIEFWANGDQKGDVYVDWITLVDAESLYGQMTVSNAAEIGWRDVLVRSDAEGVFMEDAFEILDAPPDLDDVGISLWFYTLRGIDNTTGSITEYVYGGAMFYLPLDPPCPPDPESSCTDGRDNDGDGYTDCSDSDCEMDPSCSLGGPQPYDANGVFQTRETGGYADCPPNETVGAGDYVWFESPCNVVTFEKTIDSASGQIYYSAPLTFDDYCPGQYYDLHTQGEEGGIGEYVLEGVQPTVPADWEMVSPDLWGNYTHDRNDSFDYTWTPAQTYPDAWFITQIAGTLVSTGEGGYAGAVPWDDGVHSYEPVELLELEPGNVSFTAYSYIEGPTFGFPFSTIQTNQSRSYILLQASMVLE